MPATLLLLPLVLAVRQPVDTAPSRLLGAIPATAIGCRRQRASAIGEATEETTLDLGDPLFGQRRVTLLASATGLPVQYRERVTRPAPAQLVVWFTAGRAWRDAVHRGRDGDLSVEPLGLRRATTLAAVVRARCRPAPPAGAR